MYCFPLSIHCFLFWESFLGFPPLSLFSTTKGWVYRLLLFLLLRNLPVFTPLSMFSTTKGVGLPAFSFLASSQPAGFSTPFDVFYNKGVGLPAFAFLASSQPAGFSTPFNISSLKWVKMLVNYTLYTLFHLHFPYSLIVHITTYFLSITYNCPLLPTILYFVPTSWKVSLTQVSNKSLLCNILTSLTHAIFQQVFIA